MGVTECITEVLHCLATMPSIHRMEWQVELRTVKGRVHVKSNEFLDIYFNEKTGTLAFALVVKEQRIWGIDFDRLRGWHRHPREDPATHEPVEPMTIREIMAEFQQVTTAVGLQEN